jgi:hypothetical protein
MEDLFKIGGEEYFFDLDKISDFIRLERQEQDLVDILSQSDDQTKEEDGVEEEIPVMPEESYGQMIDITKWELTKAMIETVLSEQGEVDESMGVAKLEQQLSIPFRISFNTLLINKILKKNG